MKREKLDPDWHKARVAARIWIKSRSGRALSPRDRRLAAFLADQRGVSDRLIQQGVLSLLGGPYRQVQTKDGPKRLLDVLKSGDLSDVLGAVH